MNSGFARNYVYFEKQSNDRLCGVHCINALLQAPYYDPIQLSEIGLKLDEMEKNLMGSQASSANVDDDGNFNIQVLTEALSKYGCDVRPLKKREAITLVEQTEKIEALIFNSSTHWYSIRKIDGIWFNLNSTNSNPGPEIISDFYLSAFIQGAEDIGYSNFLVTKLPQLPDIKSSVYSNRFPYQRLVSYVEIIKAREIMKENDKKRYAKDTKDIKRDPNKKEEKYEDDEEDEEAKRKKEEEKKFKAFTGKGTSIENVGKKTEMYFEDDEMKQAYELSLIEYVTQLKKDLPIEPKEGYNITIRINDKCLTRKWNGFDYISDIENYIRSEIQTFDHVELFEAFPRKVYNNPTMTIETAKLSKNQSLMARIL